MDLLALMVISRIRIWERQGTAGIRVRSNLFVPSSICCMVPAMVISETGYASLPFSIHKNPALQARQLELN